MAKKNQTFSDLQSPVKAFILILILAFISIAYYFSLHMNLAEEIESAESQYKKLQKDFIKAKQRQEEIKKVNQELIAREDIDRNNKRVLPEHAEIPAFLRDVNGKAELSGLQMKLVDPKPEESKQSFVKVPVDLEMEGHFHQIAKFFNNISQIDRAISMENINLKNALRHSSSKDVEEDGVKLKVSVQATTFRRPAPKVAVKRAGGAK